MQTYKLFIGGNIYGAGNIGDDAILEGIIKILEKQPCKFFYSIATHKGKKIKLGIRRVKFVNSYDFCSLAGEIRNSDYYIAGGGTLIGDELGLAYPLEYNAKLISLAKILGKKVFVFCIGANNLKSKWSQNIVKSIFGLSDCMVLRDRQSFRVCSQLIKNREKLFFTADPAFLLKPKKTKRTEMMKKKLKKGKFFGINVVNEVWKDIKEYKKTLAEVCDYMQSKYCYTPVFFCNEVRPDKSYDYQANQETSSYMKKKFVLLKPVYYSPAEMIEIISNFKFVIGMRMHALMFTALASVPFVSLSRIDKVDNFMKMFDLNSSCSISKPNKHKIIREAENIVRNREKYLKLIDIKMGIIKRKTEETALIFSQIFNKNYLLKYPKFNFFSLKYIPKKALIASLLK